MRVIYWITVFFIISGHVFGQSSVKEPELTGVYVLEKEYDTNFRLIDGVPRLNDVNRELKPVPFMSIAFGDNLSCLVTFVLGNRQFRQNGMYSLTDRTFDNTVYKGTLSLSLKQRPPFVIWIEATGIDIYSFTILEKHGYSLVDNGWKELPYLILYQGTMKKKT